MKLVYLLFAVFMTPNVSACCDRMEPDFFVTVGDALRYEQENQVKYPISVIIAEVMEVKTIFPYPRPSEMTVRVLDRLHGPYDARTLTLNRGTSSGRRSFEEFIPGRKYLIAFAQDEDEYYLPMCGTYAKEF